MPISKTFSFTYTPLHPYEVHDLLSKLNQTSPGPCSLPHWILKQCSVELAEPICHILNASLSTGNLPSQWLSSLVSPVPKIPHPKSVSDS